MLVWGFGVSALRPVMIVKWRQHTAAEAGSTCKMLLAGISSFSIINLIDTQFLSTYYPEMVNAYLSPGSDFPQIPAWALAIATPD
jgi:hypothetical protein